MSSIFLKVVNPAFTIIVDKEGPGEKHKKKNEKTNHHHLQHLFTEWITRVRSLSHKVKITLYFGPAALPQN